MAFTRSSAAWRGPGHVLRQAELHAAESERCVLAAAQRRGNLDVVEAVPVETAHVVVGDGGEGDHGCRRFGGGRLVVRHRGRGDLDRCGRGRADRGRGGLVNGRGAGDVDDVHGGSTQERGDRGAVRGGVGVERHPVGTREFGVHGDVEAEIHVVGAVHAMASCRFRGCRWVLLR